MEKKGKQLTENQCIYHAWRLSVFLKYVFFDHCTEQQSKKLWLVFFGFPDYASDGSIIVSL